MYIDYFGLKEPPFSITPDPHYLYMSDRHREAFAHLLYGLDEGGGFVQLTGEVGTGKTTLCRCLLEQLPANVDVAFILNPKLSEIELLASICDELHIPYPAGTTSLKVLVDSLHSYLLEARGRGRRTVVIIDEAQNLAPGVLEQVRLLTNLETTTEKLLRVILIGQPELITVLDAPELRQLSQRITARYHLLPCSERETYQYIHHRMGVAGRQDPVFTGKALKLIYKTSEGVPRLINVICDRSLLGAFVEGKRIIDVPTVRQAIVEVQGHKVPSSRPVWAYVLATLGLAGLIGAGIWFWPGNGDGNTIAQQTPAMPAPKNADSKPAPSKPALAAAQNKPAPPPAAKPPAPFGGAIRSANAMPQGKSLAGILGAPMAQTDRKTALAGLFSAWGIEANAEAERNCPGAPAPGSQCLFKLGNWNTLRLLGLPAVVELVDPAGKVHYAFVSALSGQSAVLTVANQTVTVPIDELDRLWFGRYIVLWRPPALRQGVVRPGARGRDVLWLRERIASIKPGQPPAPQPEFYDEPLRQQVIDFQRGRSLSPDGVVGLETLLHLTTAARSPDFPALGQASP